MRKLRNKRGETLVESLAAILIFSIATVGLLSMITTSATFNADAAKADALRQDQLVALESGNSAGNRGTLTITMDATELDRVTIDICGEDGALYAYYITEGGGS